MKYLLTDKCKADFIRWASKRYPFHFNKYTKTLTCMGKAFFEIQFTFQFPAII